MEFHNHRHLTIMRLNKQTILIAQTSSGITVRTSRSNAVFSSVDRGLKIAARSIVPCCRMNAANCKYKFTNYKYIIIFCTLRMQSNKTTTYSIILTVYKFNLMNSFENIHTFLRFRHLLVIFIKKKQSQ